ncbi:MAG: DUF975 family protein [Candidatus Berkelbacteria bacterium]|nr:DUF975 family protein [Candidatus Berkelbacteria bacterium]
MKQTFSVTEAVSTGWQKTIKNLWFWVLIIAISIAVSSFFSAVNAVISKNQDLATLSFAVSLISFVFSIIIQIGITKVAIAEVDSKKSTVAELFINWDFFGNYLLGSILVGLIVFAGIILLIVPGIIWGLKYSMFPYLVIDKGMGAVEAMQESSRLTMGHKWQLFGFALLKGLIALAGLLALVVGLFLALPTTTIAQAKIYRDLQGLAKAKENS